MKPIHLFRFWKDLTQELKGRRKQQLKFAIDGSSYDYGNNNLEVLSILNRSQNFKVIYVSSKEIKEEKYKFRVFRPNPVRKYVDELRLKDQNSKYISSHYAKYDEVKKLPIEFSGAVAFGDLAVTRTKIDINTNYAFQKTTYIGTIQECLSSIRPWIHSLPAIEYEGMKYIYSKWNSVLLGSKILVPSYDMTWRASVATDENKFPLCDSSVHNYLWSIGERIRYLITTRNILEEIKFSDLMGKSRKAEDYPNITSYYFGYLLMLITGIFDSITCIINWRLGKIKFKPNEISLSIRDKKNKRFIESISSFNPSLADYIKVDEFQSFMKMIYDLRNSIAHNILPGGLTYAGKVVGRMLVFQGRIGNSINSFLESSKLSKDECEEIGIYFEKIKVAIEPVSFSRYLVMDVCRKIDNTINQLSVPQKMLTTEAEMKIFRDIEKTGEFNRTNHFIEDINNALSYTEACVP